MLGMSFPHSRGTGGISTFHYFQVTLISPLIAMTYLTILIASTLAIPTACSSQLHDCFQPPKLPHANHIFNAVHSVMNQWGSSVNHNGMSIFLATIPEDLLLYHGDSRAEPVKGMQWMAFEPEHASLFVKRENVGSFAGKISDGNSRRKEMDYSHEEVGRANASTRLKERMVGWLHDYRTVRALRVLYLDGMSAAKSKKGTMDLQDIVLLNHESENSTISDMDRATRMCTLFQTTGHGNIDGVIRMEGGFEVILCHSEDVLEPVLIKQSKPLAGDTPGLNANADIAFEYYKAVASRYFGIGGGRVIVDFESMVSGYAYLAEGPDHSKTRRIRDILPSGGKNMREAAMKLLLQEPHQMEHHDWQRVADMIVSRYATHLGLLAGFTDPLSFRQGLKAVTESFYSLQNSQVDAAVKRCAMQDIPTRYNDVLAANAIIAISTTICQNIIHASVEDNDTVSIEKIQALVVYLNWPTWRFCERCKPEEICWTPIWPLGGFQDKLNPRCISEAPDPLERSYWR